MDFGISGKTALFTGGSKGMGREAATMLAAEGCNVAIVARSKPDIDEAVAAIVSSGGSAVGICADMSKRGDVDRAVAETRDAFGAPLIVVGQTKFNVPGNFEDIDPETYVESFRRYTVSQVYLLQAVLPAMKAAGWGRYVHIGSGTAKQPEGAIRHIVANATRPSTPGLLKTVSDEYAQYGITVNTVAPGWIGTDNTADYLERTLGLHDEAERREWLLRNGGVPAGRMGDPREIASLIAYLCSDLAGYINGAWISVDGGKMRVAV
jgi:3-oxoacyl-[acyl-carrier protein] reductase